MTLQHSTGKEQTGMRFSAALQEIRRIWVGYMTQCDAELGRKLAAKLQAMSAL